MHSVAVNRSNCDVAAVEFEEQNSTSLWTSSLILPAWLKRDIYICTGGQALLGCSRHRQAALPTAIGTLLGPCAATGSSVMGQDLPGNDDGGGPVISVPHGSIATNSDNNVWVGRRRVVEDLKTISLFEKMSKVYPARPYAAGIETNADVFCISCSPND